MTATLPARGPEPAAGVSTTPNGAGRDAGARERARRGSGRRGRMLETTSEAVRGPRPCGVNVTVMVQPAPASRCVPQTVVWAKSTAGAACPGDALRSGGEVGRRNDRDAGDGDLRRRDVGERRGAPGRRTLTGLGAEGEPAGTAATPRVATPMRLTSIRDASGRWWRSRGSRVDCPGRSAGRSPEMVQLARGRQGGAAGGGPGVVAPGSLRPRSHAVDVRGARPDVAQGHRPRGARTPTVPAVNVRVDGRDRGLGSAGTSRPGRPRARTRRSASGSRARCCRRCSARRRGSSTPGPLVERRVGVGVGRLTPAEVELGQIRREGRDRSPARSGTRRR